MNKLRTSGLLAVAIGTLAVALIWALSGRASERPPERAPERTPESASERAPDSASEHAQAGRGPTLIARTVIGEPAARGHYVFWTDSRASDWAIYGYDVNTGEEFVVKQLPLGASGLATDGRLLAWVESSASNSGVIIESIQVYNLSTREESTVSSSAGSELDRLALDNGTLYYGNQDMGYLVARDISTGQEQQVAAGGKEPVAAGGNVLWTELKQDCDPGPLCHFQFALQLARSGEYSKATALTVSSGPNGFWGYSASGDTAVWADAWWLEGFMIHDLRSGTNKVVSGKAVTSPVVAGDIVVWAEDATSSPVARCIKGYNTTTGRTWTVVSRIDGRVRALNILGTKIIYAVDADLHLTELGN
ncbi:MAG TPA: hypothetical protein VFR15_08885 [Chloroflexia bacterium]|nr:hypothetical protein [Chloroflexia bacterium]